MRRDLIERLTKTMEADALLVCPSSELCLLLEKSGFMDERFQGMFVKKNGDCFYICNDLYKDEYSEAFGSEMPIYHWHDNEGMDKVCQFIRDNGLAGKTIAVNTSAPAFLMADIQARLGVKITNGRELLEESRIHKTPEEMELLRRSSRVSDYAFEAACSVIRPGVTEREVGIAMLEAIKEKGGFLPPPMKYPMVNAGPGSALPHYFGGERVIQDGDAVLMDWGCLIPGEDMFSDESRTVFVGHATDEQYEVYDLVDRAQQRAQDMAVEGAWIPDLDKAAREVLDEKGYAEMLPNRLGHGVGYDYHEAPYIRQDVHRRLERGMCFSIEPGIYLPGKFGVRIENLVLINDKGETEVLNHTDRKMRVL